MKFSKEFLIDTLGDENDVVNKICDTSRWSVQYSRIFKHNGNFYSAPYQIGATEQQDESAYEYDNDEIECPEMEAFTRVITDYRLKK